MALTLSEPPGFCDLDDQVLVQENTAYAIHLGRIAKNAEFGAVRLEIFQGLYLNGETVALPTSTVDGYNYSRDELIYFCTIRNSCSAQRGGNNPQVLTDAGGNITSTGWISPASKGMSLWFTNYNVQQYDPVQPADSAWNKEAGKVYSEQWYAESSGETDNPVFQDVQRTNDGIVLVWTIAQRGKNQLTAASSPSWSDIDEALIATDKPYRTDLLQQLLENSKYCNLNTEVFWVGEYVNGETISLAAAVSQVDGYQYSLDDDVKFMVDWRWTASGSAYVQPPYSQGQMGPFFCSISPTGEVTMWVDFIHISGNLQQYPDFGRVSAFAFCTRKTGPVTLPLANQFRQVDDNFFGPGSTVRASTLLAIKKNADQAVLTPEFFGPTIYADLDIIPLPISPIDGYEYSRQELHYIWRWRDTTNQVGQNLRIPLYAGTISQSTGQVHMQIYRLPPGSVWVSDNNTLCRMTVLVVGFRGAELPELIDTPVNPPVVDFPPTDVGNLFGAVPAAEVDLAPSGPGDFTVAHSFGGTPALVLIQMTSGGNIWFQAPTRYDGTNLYLTASDADVTAKALLFDIAPEAEVALAPAADGNFGVSHSLGAVPGLLLIQMTSGGNIWGQNPSEADDKFLYLTASGLSLTGNAELWLALTGEATPSMKWKSIPISSTAPGNFEVQHEIGETPKAVLINMNTPGFPAFWFQTARYDDVKIYLVAPDAGVSGFAEVLY